MKYLFFYLFTISVFANCTFEDLTKGDLTSLPRFEIKKTQTVAFESQLFAQFKELGSFDELECESLLKITYYDRLTKGKFKILSTLLDDCDGGNSYGLILEDNKVLATIEDSEIYCLNN